MCLCVIFCLYVLLKYSFKYKFEVVSDFDYLAKKGEGNSTVSSRGMIEIMQVEKVYEYFL